MRKARSRARRRLSGLDPLSWSIFAVLVVSLFFKRLIDAWGTVTARDCDEQHIAFIGPTPAFDGPMEWLLVIGLAGAGLLLVQALDNLLTRDVRPSFWMLWLVNLALAGALVWAFLVAWAFFNPSAGAARPVFQFTASLAPQQHYVTPVRVAERQYASEGDWIWDEATRSWTNEPLGMIRRIEPVRTCEPADMRRAQIALIYGEHLPDGDPIAGLDERELTKPVTGYTLYDLEGNYLVTLGGPYIQRSALTRQRDAAYDPAKAALSPEEAERRYFEWVRDEYLTPRPEPRQPPPSLSRTEIDQIVAESWGDERPLWYEDE